MLFVKTKDTLTIIFWKLSSAVWFDSNTKLHSPCLELKCLIFNFLFFFCYVFIIWLPHLPLPVCRKRVLLQIVDHFNLEVSVQAVRSELKARVVNQVSWWP